MLELNMKLTCSRLKSTLWVVCRKILRLVSPFVMSVLSSSSCSLSECAGVGTTWGCGILYFCVSWRWLLSKPRLLVMTLEARRRWRAVSARYCGRVSRRVQVPLPVGRGSSECLGYPSPPTLPRAHAGPNCCHRQCGVSHFGCVGIH